MSETNLLDERRTGLEPPWIAVPIREGLCHIYRDDRGETTLPIAVLDSSRDGYEPTRAGVVPAARLMAAAPELLEALRGCVAGLEALAHNRADPVTDEQRAAMDELHRLIHNGRTAIASVTPREEP